MSYIQRPIQYLLNALEGNSNVEVHPVCSTDVVIAVDRVPCGDAASLNRAVRALREHLGQTWGVVLMPPGDEVLQRRKKLFRVDSPRPEAVVMQEIHGKVLPFPVTIWVRPFSLTEKVHRRVEAYVVLYETLLGEGHNPWYAELLIKKALAFASWFRPVQRHSMLLGEQK